MTDKPILLVEDTPDDGALTLRALEQDSILNQVVVAKDGAEALDYLFGTGVRQGRNADDKPAVVLLDLKLPKVDGQEVMRQIRAVQRTRLQPVVILTSSKEESNLLNAYELGANAHVCMRVGLIRFTEALRQLGLSWLMLNEAPSNRRPC
jgi:CheY-like chemotaxis protein